MSSSHARKGIVAIALIAALGGQTGMPAARAATSTENQSRPGRDRQTATPIKHVIIIVGENRSFDHLYATYTPRHKRDKVLNLLSQRIVNADGSPGPNFSKAHQFKIVSPPNGGKFFIGAGRARTPTCRATCPPSATCSIYSTSIATAIATEAADRQWPRAGRLRLAGAA